MTVFTYGMITGLGILIAGIVTGVLVCLNNYKKIKAQKEALEAKLAETSSS